MYIHMGVWMSVDASIARHIHFHTHWSTISINPHLRNDYTDDEVRLRVAAHLRRLHHHRRCRSESPVRGRARQHRLPPRGGALCTLPLLLICGVCVCCPPMFGCMLPPSLICGVCCLCLTGWLLPPRGGAWRFVRALAYIPHAGAEEGWRTLTNTAT